MVDPSMLKSLNPVKKVLKAKLQEQLEALEVEEEAEEEVEEDLVSEEEEETVDLMLKVEMIVKEDSEDDSEEEKVDRITRKTKEKMMEEDSEEDSEVEEEEDEVDEAEASDHDEMRNKKIIEPLLRLPFLLPTCHSVSMMKVLEKSSRKATWLSNPRTSSRRDLDEARDSVLSNLTTKETNRSHSLPSMANKLKEENSS